jgi:hypothetical protein
VGPVLVKVHGPGSEVAGKGLRAIDPARYGSLQHPGDGYSFDVFTQVARAVRTGACVGGLKARRLIAAGQSQSAFALLTYYDGVQPLTHAFDGFFVHSRGASGLPLVGPGQSTDIAKSIGRTPEIFRTDQGTPVMDVQSESDVTSVLDSYAARQPDSKRFRLWEVAGTAGSRPERRRPVRRGSRSRRLGVRRSSATRTRSRWAASARRRWTYRSRRCQGVPGLNPLTICLLLGSAKPLSGSQLKQLYSSRAAYLRRYEADLDRAIKAGFVLTKDPSALLGFAQPSRIP